MIKLYHYNRTKLKDFYMGPSVKFVLPIIDELDDGKILSLVGVDLKQRHFIRK